MPSYDVLREFGLEISIILGLSWFLVKQLWPWMKQQNDSWRKQAEDSVKAMVELKQVIDQQSAINQRVLSELKRIRVAKR